MEIKLQGGKAPVIHAVGANTLCEGAAQRVVQQISQDNWEGEGMRGVHASSGGEHIFVISPGLVKALGIFPQYTTGEQTAACAMSF